MTETEVRVVLADERHGLKDRVFTIVGDVELRKVTAGA